jgi:hypothetical protein
MDPLAQATIALAIVTVLLAVATVFGREIRSWLIRPRLRLSGDTSPRYVVRSPTAWLDRMDVAPAPTPAPDIIRVPSGETPPWYWIRMEIRNSRLLSDTAQDVEIFIQEIQEKTALGDFKSRPNVGLNLCWSWGQATLFTHILPGATKFFNIGHVVHPDDRPNQPGTYECARGAGTRKCLYDTLCVRQVAA